MAQSSTKLDSAASSATDSPVSSPCDNCLVSLRRDAGSQTDECDDEPGQLDLLTPTNAQNFLSPLACVFAANLPVTWSDDRIKAALDNVFQPFGECFIKVKRDSTQLPVAFVQFASFVDCENALTSKADISIGGRVIRLEQAKCERTLFCSSRSYRAISYSDFVAIQSLVQKYGEIDTIAHNARQDAPFCNLPDGVWIKFRHYGTCQDAFKALLHHPRWHFELIRDDTPHNNRQLPLAYNERFGHQGVEKRKKRRSRTNLGDCGSVIFIEGIPMTTREDQLCAQFSHFGTVRGINLFSPWSGHHDQAVQFQSASLAYYEAYAGTNTCDFAAAFGMYVPDGGYWSCSSVQVSCTYIKRILPRHGGFSSRVNDRIFHGPQYAARHGGISNFDSGHVDATSVLWSPALGYECSFASSHLEGSSSVLVSSLVNEQGRAIHHSATGRHDWSTAEVTANGAHACHYSLYEESSWDGDLNSASDGTSTIYSSMSPRR